MWTKLAEYGLIAIVAVMPLHAFLSVWIASSIGHRAILQSWKECVLIALAGLAARQLYLNRNSDPVILRKLSTSFVAAYATWAILVSVVYWRGVQTFAFGLKTDIFFLVLLLAATILSTNKTARLLQAALLGSTAVVVVFGTLQALLLPKDFLVHFGYGPATIAPYLTLTAYTPAIRILSTLGGPNQLGSFLILPICLVLSRLIRKFQWWHMAFLALCAITLWHTYSRSAWIGSAAAVLVTIVLSVPRPRRRQTAIAIVAVSILLSGLTYATYQRNVSLQYYLLHGSRQNYGQLQTSDGERTRAQSSALRTISARPFGSGLGTAGPASFKTNQPIISENYYLQIALELGVVGLGLFLAIMLAFGFELARRPTDPLTIAALASLIGISIVNLFLHGWADSSTALVWATVAGASLRLHEK